ncbi:MAG: PD40 domain-containing protein, partial [Deltaproteobacteria bacterium]|nr:PD40 domain-containing protein [Deltaproteobacteria bacterium]
FFRVLTYGDRTFKTWKTKICVINYDGSGFRELTSGEFTDYNPTFMRDGTNRIVFNRYNRHGMGRCEIYMTTPSASPGEEIKISHPTIPAYEWVYSSLKDGHLFIHRIQSAEREVYLLKPNPGGLGEYQRVSMPTTNYIHKANISPDETKITYMFDNDNNGATYNDVQIAWAKFDPKGPRVYDQKLITPYNLERTDAYPKWSPDGSLIIYHSNRMHNGRKYPQIYAYRLSDGVEKNISPDKTLGYVYPCMRGFPK